MPKFSPPSTVPELYYPSNLMDTKSNFLRIEANKYQYGGGGPILGAVSLYHPSGVSFADGAGFSTFDMGPLGREFLQGVTGAESGSDLMLRATAITKNAIDKGAEGPGSAELRTMLAIKIAKDSGAAQLAPGTENLQQVYGASRGVAVNPNTATAFQNMNIRAYTFNFKMIAESPDESDTIRQIQTFFREHMYPERGPGDYLLTYPATFTVKFYTADGSENPYYPKMYELNLTNFQTNYNGSSHLHFDGGAPVEVDISLSFQETKVLTKADFGEGYL